MSSLDATFVMDCLHALLSEIFRGAPAGGPAWILNPGDQGLLHTLGRLSAEQASVRPEPGRSSVAAHANHLRFSLNLVNRWATGENPFADANWPSSWQVQTVTEAEWAALIAGLGQEATAWMEAVKEPREWDEIALTGVMASAAHAAYHMGAIRQLCS